MSQTTRLQSRRRLIVVATTLLFIGNIENTVAGTVNIPIANHSFELPDLTAMGINGFFGPIDGWTGIAGVEKISQVPALVGKPHDGTQVAYVIPGGYLEQNVGAYDATATYNLGYLAAVWWDVGRYNVSLLVGGNVLASYTSPQISYGDWDTVTSLIALPNPSLSGDLSIRLSYVPSAGIGNEREFESITLTKTTPDLVPEPGTALLLASSLSLLGLARRRT